MTVLVAAAAVLGESAATAVAHSAAPPHSARDVTQPLWGVAGGYDGITPGAIRAAGLQFVLLEPEWARAEPAPGIFDEAYFAQLRAQLSAFRAAGLRVVLNAGYEVAPAWLLEQPNARYVDQRGEAYTGSPEPNLVFATEYRPAAARYLQRLFAELGTSFFAVRVGGGHWNELTYPQEVEADGRVANRYWAFDGAAARTDPVPGWRPGDPSPHGEAARFLRWYLDSLTQFQQWQVATVRLYYPGTIAVLYGSYGMRAGDFARAVATNLSGSSSAEVNGEVQRGLDERRQIAAITDRNVAVWATWVDNQNTARRLATLADRHGLAKMGENTGAGSPADLRRTTATARALGYRAFMWVRLPTLLCSCDGLAWLTEYERLIRR